MNNIDLIKIATIQLDKATETVRTYLRKNTEPTYTDNILKEDLYSIDIVEESEFDFPPFIVEWINELKAIDPDIVYFRFEQW